VRDEIFVVRDEIFVVRDEIFVVPVVKVLKYQSFIQGSD
jgi:hypothetical protein